MHLLENITQKSPTNEDPIVQLRLQHIGSILDIEQLTDLKFSQLANVNGWSTWVRYSNKKSHRLKMFLAPHGTICMFRYSSYLRHQPYDHSNAPVGWFECESITAGIASRISTELLGITKNFPLATMSDEFESLLREIGINPIDLTIPAEVAICAGASHFIDKGNTYLASLLTYTILKRLNEINDPDVLLDLPSICGHLGLKDEFFYVISRLHDKRVMLTAESLTNIGVVLCDHIQHYELAIKCFESAVKMNPYLEQPRQNIQVAASNQMNKDLYQNHYAKIIQLGERVLELSPDVSEHGFYSFLGLAYEGNGQKEKAADCYVKALDIHPSCSIASPGLRRIWDKSNNETVNQVVNWLMFQQEYSWLTPEYVLRSE